GVPGPVQCKWPAIAGGGGVIADCPCVAAGPGDDPIDVADKSRTRVRLLLPGRAVPAVYQCVPGRRRGQPGPAAWSRSDAEVAVEGSRRTGKGGIAPAMAVPVQQVLCCARWFLP